jgi:hypothetical protein
VSPDNKPPRLAGDERQTLIALLRFQRASVARKLDGLSEQQVRQRVVASETNLLWLVRHLERAERTWVLERFAGRTPTVSGEVLEATTTTPRALDQYRATAREVDALVEDSTLDQRCADPDYADVPLRWVLAHLLEETARHAGHADIIREILDGTTGR